MSNSKFDETLKLMSKCTVAVCEDDKPMGTGVIVSLKGLVATCEHVIRQAKSISIKVGSRQIPAEVYKKDQERDIAVLKLIKEVKNSVHIEEVGELKQGREIFVLGFSLKSGLRDSKRECASLSKGIISKIQTNGSGRVDYIQINASVDHGFSGGPVFDESGRIIGFVTTALFEGMACCIPTDTVLSLVPWHKLDSSTIPFVEYAERESDRYRKWNIFKHYIDLRCRTKDGNEQDLMKYVLDVWLPDQSKPLLAILGEFGSGKTFFCQKLFCELLKGYRPGRKLPFLVTLCDMKRYGYKSVKDLLVDQVETKLGLPNLEWSTLEEILRFGEIILIYDGFEEMSMKVSRFQMVDNFRDLRSTIIPGAKAIVTCRTHYFSTEEEEKQIFGRIRRPDHIESLIMEESNLDNVSIVYLESFNDGDIQAYLKSKLKNDWKSFYQKIKDPSFYDLPDLAKRPIFLDMIVEVIPHLEFVGEKLTGTRLYQQYTNLCFQREYKRLGLAVEQQSEIVEELAFEVYKERLIYLDRNLIKAVCSKVTHYKPEIDVEQFIRKYPFFRRAEKAGGELSFIHQSFFEFFVAKRIFRSVYEHDHSLYATEYLTSQIDKYLYELLDSANGVEIIVAWLRRHPDVNVRMNCVLTLGRSGKKEFVPVLQECLEQEPDIGVAGRISESLVSLGDRESLLKFLGNLEKYAYLKEETGKPDGHRLLYDVVGTLEEIDSGVIDSLVKNLENPNARIRKYAAFILGRIRTPKAIPGLIRLLENPNESVRARRYTAAALGLIGDPSALPILEDIAQSSENEYIYQDCSRAIERIEGERKRSQESLKG